MSFSTGKLPVSVNTSTFDNCSADRVISEVMHEMPASSVESKLRHGIGHACLYNRTYPWTVRAVMHEFRGINACFVETINACTQSRTFLIWDQSVMQLRELLTGWLIIYCKGVVQQSAVGEKCLVTAQSERKKGCVIVVNVWWSSRDSPRYMYQSLTRPINGIDCQVMFMSTFFACCRAVKSGRQRKLIWRKPELIRIFAMT
jgi:hypothetical protein